MADHDCARNGHHWHEADGAIFNRKRDLAKRDTLEVRFVMTPREPETIDG